MSAPPSLAAQLITISVLSLQRQISHYNLASRSTWNSTYDFVVVGAGGAGAIVASRLSENPAVSVLLLEAGGPETAATDIPANYYEWVGNPHTDWNYPMAPQPQLGQAFTMPAHMSVGRILGGSTTISGMVYNRGNRRNFDEWDYHYGCRGWNYNNTLQYFIVSENQTDPNYLNGSSAMYHGTSGPIAVSSDWSRLNTMPVYGDYLRTAQMAGYPLIDVNADSQNGVTLFQHTIQDGSKVTSSSAYLAPNKNRTNLHIVSHAYVTGVQFNGNTAHSVSFTRTGRDYTVRANREIILSAGTIGSAQLLLLSGVGPRAHLSSLGIPVVADLPVGNNLHDHTNTILYFDIPDQSLAYQPIDLNAQNLYNLYVNHNGPLVMFPNAATYIVSRQNNVTAWPDVMTEMVRSNNHWKNLTYLASMYQDQESWADYWRLYSGRRLLSFDVQMVRPRARGTLRLASANPNTMPIIDPNYFGDPRDIDAMVDGIRTVLNRITSQGPFAQSARFISQPVPGCQLCDNEPYCEQYIRCFIRQTSVAVFRHAGTCRCGASTDPNAVVDERLRVLNVQRLRVVDGSIMPQIINANSWPATAMIAEYASAMIRADNNI